MIHCHLIFLSSLVSRPVLLLDYHNLSAVKHHKTIFCLYKKKREEKKKKEKQPTSLCCLPQPQREGGEVMLPVCCSNEHQAELIKTCEAERRAWSKGWMEISESGINADKWLCFKQVIAVWLNMTH